MTEPTKLRLAHALRSAGFEALANRAETGEFSDFDSPHATPKIILARELAKIYQNYSLTSPVMAAAARIAVEVKDGKWDDSKEEAEAWAKSQGL